MKVQNIEHKKVEGGPFVILLVDDNTADTRLTKEAFGECGVSSTLYMAEDGVEALDYLRQTGEFSDCPRPDLILLDLNLPRKNGIEVLKEIKSDDNLKIIPVIVLTTSNADIDILKCYALHANCYITKPVDLNHFYDVVASIGDFWFGFVNLPHGPRRPYK